jgi:hypothetical protein
MAVKVKTRETLSFARKSKKKRPGIHAKSKNSKLKNSKNYVKAYVAQGK